MKKISIFLALLLVAAILISSCGAPADDTQQDTESEALSSAPATDTETAKPVDDGPKNIMIFGDSYSTFEGYIPEGYNTWYSTAARPENNLRRVEQTWWYLLCKDMGYNLVRNDSFSGSTLGYTGYSGADTSKSTSFIYRLEKLTNEGFFKENDIDIIFVFGCTNDSWSDAPLGELKLEGISRADLYNVLPAIPYFLGKLKEAAPNAEIVFIINTDLKPEICDAIRTASAHYGTHYIELHDIDKGSGHPTTKGMASINEQVKAYLTEELQ